MPSGIIKTYFGDCLRRRTGLVIYFVVIGVRVAAFFAARALESPLRPKRCIKAPIGELSPGFYHVLFGLPK
jgi:hypothetical protein